MPPRCFGAAVAGLTALALSACGSGGGPGPAPGASGDDARLHVVASTDVYGSIAEAVGGERTTVEPLITDPAADPHSYESTPAEAVTVSEAQLVVFNGGGYDPFVPQLVEATQGEPAVVEVAALAGASEQSAGEAHANEHGARGGHEHGNSNEHFWYSLPVMQELATRLATELSALDPAGEAEYLANAEAFTAQVDGLHERVRAIGSAHAGAHVAVTEPLPVHLIEAAGLHNVTPDAFAEAIEEDTDPSAAVLHETLTLLEDGSVQVLIVNAQTETPTTQQVRRAAQTAGVPVVEMTETLAQGASGYVSWMGSQLDALSGALAEG